MNPAINVLLFPADPFVAYLHIAYVLSVKLLLTFCLASASRCRRMSCTRVRFPESTTTGRSVGDRFTVSAVTVTKGTPLGPRPNLDTPAI